MKWLLRKNSIQKQATYIPSKYHISISFILQGKRRKWTGKKKRIITCIPKVNYLEKKKSPGDRKDISNANIIIEVIIIECFIDPEER